MKKQLFFLLTLMSLAGASRAYDFAAGCSTGQTLYYSIISGTNVSVTYPGDDYYDGYPKPTGDLVIPSYVVGYNGTTYTVTNIGEHAFFECSGLTSVTIPNSVTSIGYWAFCVCSGLTSVTIPNSVTSIGDYVFGDCTGLTSVTIPNSVTSIGYYAFSRCRGLTSVTIPNSVTSIGDEAFRWCSGLTSVTIPNSVTSIGDYAFSGCSGLTSPVFNNHCFAYFPNGYSTSYTIPDGISQICGGAFSGCSGLTSVTIPNSVTCIGGGAFSGCTGLTSVTIPNSVTCIGGGAFQYCSGLTSVTIGNSVDTIQAGAFNNCTGMQVLHLGSALHYVGGKAFHNCDHLDTIYSYNPTPATVANVDAFENVWKGLPLIVPTGSRNAYASAYAWREFTNIQEGTLPQGIEDAVYDGMVMKSVDGRIVIDGADGHRVTLTDIQGRTLYRNTATGTLTVDVPASGIYLLQLDDCPAKRISVVR